MNDAQVEQVIQAKSLNVAPRVTKEQIDALMARVIFTYDQPKGTTSTLAHAFLDGKFLLATGHSACVSADNLNPEQGQRMARSKAEAAARDELWKLEGYALFKSPHTQNPKRYTWADVATYDTYLQAFSESLDYTAKMKDGSTWAGSVPCIIRDQAVRMIIDDINRQVAEREKGGAA